MEEMQKRNYGRSLWSFKLTMTGSWNFCQDLETILRSFLGWKNACKNSNNFFPSTFLPITRLSCVPSLKENPASRLNDYFRDELASERDLESTYYLYQNSGLLFGHYTDGSWQFGLKVTEAFPVMIATKELAL